MVGNIKRVGNNGVIGAANECCIPTEKKRVQNVIIIVLVSLARLLHHEIMRTTPYFFPLSPIPQPGC